MTKVLHILKSNIYSGAENVAITIIKNMPADYDCLYMCAKGPIEYKLNEMGVAHVCVDEVNVASIRLIVERFKPDIIHAHDFSASFMAARAVKNKIKVVSHLHNNWPWCRTLHPKVIGYSIFRPFIDKILVVSSSVKEEFLFKKVMADAVVVGNPFDADKVREAAGGIDEGSSPEEVGEYDIILLGRLTQQKQPLTFIRIVDEIRRNIPDVKAVIVGGGELEDECKSLIASLGLENNITMAGFVANPYLYLNNAKLSMMPSLWEGFGLVALEAMTLGKPVIASKVGGLQDIVNDTCGKVIAAAPDSADFVQDMAAEAVGLLSDSECYEKMSAGAVQRAQEYSNIGEYIEQIVREYQ